MASFDHPELQSAIDTIAAGGADCVLLYTDGRPALPCTGRGVRPLLQLLTNDPDALRGAVLVDKIIGKAAAMLASLGGIAAVYALTASTPALDWLQSQGLPAAARTTVPQIINRTGDGLCPLEQSVLALDDAGQGLAAIRSTVARLMAAK